MPERATDAPSLERAFALHREGRTADAERGVRGLPPEGFDVPPTAGAPGGAR